MVKFGIVEITFLLTSCVYSWFVYYRSFDYYFLSNNCFILSSLYITSINVVPTPSNRTIKHTRMIWNLIKRMRELNIFIKVKCWFAPSERRAYTAIPRITHELEIYWSNLICLILMNKIVNGRKTYGCKYNRFLLTRFHYNTVKTVETSIVPNKL